MSKILSVEITQEYIDTAESLRDGHLALCDYCVMTQSMKSLFNAKINTGKTHAFVVLEDDVEEIVATLLTDAKYVVCYFDDLRFCTSLKPQTVTIELREKGLQYLSEFGKTKMVENV